MNEHTQGLMFEALKEAVKDQRDYLFVSENPSRIINEHPYSRGERLRRNIAATEKALAKAGGETK